MSDDKKENLENPKNSEINVQNGKPERIIRVGSRKSEV
jgi:hypothetical protein